MAIGLLCTDRFLTKRRFGHSAPAQNAFTASLKVCRSRFKKEGRMEDNTSVKSSFSASINEPTGRWILLLYARKYGPAQGARSLTCR
jgi:hypothetical protein